MLVYWALAYVKSIRLLLIAIALPLWATRSFDELVDQYFEEYYFRYKPTEGTAAGFHQYDKRLEDYSRAAVQARISLLKHFRNLFEKLDPARLGPQAASDRELVLSQIKGDLLEWQEIRPWENNPDRYSSDMSRSIFVIMSRKFAPAEERLTAAIARERQMRAVFAAARQNLKNPPRIYTEITLEQLPGIIRFFQQDVPAAFQTVTEPRLRAEFHESNQAVIEALNEFQGYLKNNLLAGSNGDFRIGSANYRRKLLYDEMVDTRSTSS